MTVEQLFQRLADATISIPKRYHKTIFQSMAYNLIQWDGIPPNVVQEALKACNETLKNVCVGCYNELVESNDEYDEPLCNECLEKE